jgi:hypothetical protein
MPRTAAENREHVKRWQRANPDKMLAKKQRYKAKRRALIDAAKNCPCVDCGQQLAPEKMHFDHRPGTVKLFNIGREATRSIKSLTAEIAKCDVRCIVCHAKRHAAERRAV